MSQDTWTIGELGERVAGALAVDYAGAPNNRVRDVPDRRTIRYYTTLGLLDRPTMRGRTALYGLRHLLQLAVIKRLQAKGWPLAKIQRSVIGMRDKDLALIANIPADVTVPPKEAAGDRVFWKEPPAQFVSEVSTVEPERGTSAAGSGTAGLGAVLQGIALTADVTLLLKTIRSLDSDDIQAIRSVAAPLIEVLHQRRLLARAEKGTSHDPAAADSV